MNYFGEFRRHRTCSKLFYHARLQKREAGVVGEGEETRERESWRETERVSEKDVHVCTLHNGAAHTLLKLIRALLTQSYTPETIETLPLIIFNLYSYLHCRVSDAPFQL